MTDTVITISELNKIREWVRKKNNITYRAVTDITPFAALQANALSHLRKDWIEWREDSVVIRIPSTADCNQTKGTSGLGEYITDRKRPCSTCRNTGETNQFEATPPGSRLMEPRSRKVILHKGIAEPAIETLEHIFNTLGRDEIGVRRQGIQDITHDIATSAALDREFTYNELMRTQLLIHAAYEVDLEVIHEQSPFHEQLNRRIIRESEFDHPEISGTLGVEEFLFIIERNAPVSIDDIADMTGLVRGGVNDRLKKLKQRNRVEVVKKEQMSGGRYKTQYFDVTKPPSDPFTCQYGCGKTSDSIVGISKHESMMHE